MVLQLRALKSLIVFTLLGTAGAQEVTLRLHHFLSEASLVHSGYLVGWAERIEAHSSGRIDVEIYPNMQLGGSPASLVDQVVDGVVDVVWTLPGYTAGRFPLSEAFELPFMSGLAEQSSQALCRFYFEFLQEEYRGMRVLNLHTAGPGVLHLKGEAVRELADLRGRRIRAPNRVTAEALALLGAEPLGMPVPEVPEALSRGVIDGALLPWEITAPLRIAELVDSHTAMAGERGLYTSIFLLAMNERSYDRLPDDLKAVVDDNSIHGGCEEARLAGANNDAADVPARLLALEAGNELHLIDEQEAARWREALRPLEQAWLERAARLGRDGAAMLARARELVAEFERGNAD